ncbi:MAG: hypothetical protein RQ736_06885 [Thiogranum sp.]|nr:hypothetical protein [Thiogranum sp.]
MKSKTAQKDSKTIKVVVAKRVSLNEVTKRSGDGINAKEIAKVVRSDLKVLKGFSFG